jgi:cysteine desulfurase / selenocysteine lyase
MSTTSEALEQQVGSQGRALRTPHTLKVLPVFDVQNIRKDFPILSQKIHGKPLVYLDNAASTQKPKMVVDAICHTYLTEYANIHRGVHLLSELCTKAYEDTRVVLQHFIHARESREIVFVRGTTEGINLVAQTFGRKNVGEGDEVLISGLEHHSNIVPWQLLCEEKNARLRVVPIDDNGDLILEEFERLLSPRTKIVAIGHVSNALGTINPIREIIRLAHDRGVPVLVDGAQAAPHLKIDVQELDADFYTFSGHKIYGPSGIGVLYGKASLLENMPPYQGGGDMISSVTFEKTTYNVLPYKFEAGTPNIGGTIGLGAAIDYVEKIGLDVIAAYEHGLLKHATEVVSDIPGVRIVGTAKEKAAVVSFVMEGIHPHDIGTILDQQGIAVRTGHHCAQPIMDRFGIPATARASMAFYNTLEEIDALGEGIRKVKEVFG